jgi:uncharacterized membrane protein (Fun14 family)
MATDLPLFAALLEEVFHLKVMKVAAVIVGLFIALAYLEYQRILNVDWHKVQAISQNGIDWVAVALTHVSSTIGASHPGTLSNIGIPLVSSISAGFAVGMVRG